MPEVGRTVERREDQRLLLGEGRYVGDLWAPGMLTAKVVRSTQAHAHILGIDTKAAESHPGVVAVFTANDLGPAQRPLDVALGRFPAALNEAWKPFVRECPMYPLAEGKVRYVGEPLALIVAEDPYVAEDAADFVTVTYEPLPPVVNAAQALAADAPRLFEDWDNNVALNLDVTLGDVDDGFRRAKHHIREHLTSQRYAGVPLEGRGILAVPEPTGELVLTVWTSHQLPHMQRSLIAGALSLVESAVRVVQPDVGGGFGTKGGAYPEDILIPFAALRLGRPVRWLEDQREHFMASSHSREQIFDVDVAFDDDGSIRALRYEAVIDAGAYLVYPVTLPVIGLCHMLGPYQIPALGARVRSVVTNKAVSAPCRGAGRPEVAFVINRVVDRIAQTLDKDPVSIRRRLLIQPSQLPYSPGVLFRDGNPMILDSGDYPALLDKCVSGIAYREFRDAQAEARREGRYLGIGVACTVESTGIGPFEGARVRILANGMVRVYPGVASTGQGHATSLAQVCADALGAKLDDIEVVTGDTATIEYGLGAWHSRAAVMAGNAVHMAALRLHSKVLRIAAYLLEISEDDLEVVAGQVRVKGAPSKYVSFADCAQSASPDRQLPPGVEPGLEDTSYFTSQAPTWASAAHAVTVQVHPETGEVRIIRYVVAHDCGRVINPGIVSGQLVGGIAAGIGGALLEELVYNEDGQPLTTTLMDYLLPRVSDIPDVEIIHQETLTPLNPLGIKGAGEAGTLGPPAAIAAAVEDALSPYGVRIRSTPLSPHAILDAVRASHSAVG